MPKILTFIVLLLCTNVFCEPAFSKVGIITSLRSTLEALKEKTVVVSYEQNNGRPVYQGVLGGVPVVLTRSFMGKVNNAVTAQILISEYQINQLISLGPAGAVNETLAPGDIILCEKVYQHDFGTIKPYGFLWNKAPSSYNDYLDRFFIDQLMEHGRNGQPSGARLSAGTIVTGDQFIASIDKRRWLEKKFNAAAVDMSAAAIVQTAYANNVPVMVVRFIPKFCNP
jgi:adenosylhomocysteine nucleosidase